MVKKLIYIIFMVLLMLCITAGNCYADTYLGEEIYENHNDDSVSSNPQFPTVFTISQPNIITFLENYHYVNNGLLPGTISLRHEDGTTYGPWQTTGKIGQNDVPNAYWGCYPNETIKLGTYTIIDSDNATWSNNEQSGYCGMTKVWGIKKVLDGNIAGDLTLYKNYGPYEVNSLTMQREQN